jgi:mono/diheme cytochrome c family protein
MLLELTGGTKSDTLNSYVVFRLRATRECAVCHGIDLTGADDAVRPGFSGELGRANGGRVI